MSAITRAFRHVLIYQGHRHREVLGPYSENITKRVRMFEELIPYRKKVGHPVWSVEQTWGEELIQRLTQLDPQETLLVIPAGQSTHLDRVFSIAQTSFLLHDFFYQGGRAYLNCGSAYWAAKQRVYRDLCMEQPGEKKTIIKPSILPLFSGVAEGPLCPFPGERYKVGFFSDAVTVQSTDQECTIYLSGGGYFRPDPTAEQRVKVLARYQREELLRLGVPEEECEEKENAVILAEVGKGAAMLSMFHPYYGPQDFDVERYEEAFPNCGSDWRRIQSRLSGLHDRMRFVYETMIRPLETCSFD